MKRLLCMILTGLMLFAAACTAAPKPQSETPTAAPVEATEQPNPTDEPVFVPEVPFSPLPIQNPPIDLTDPVKPIYETQSTPVETTGSADFANVLSAALLCGTCNRNLSPVSVWLAMAMVTEGADGETRAELLKLLGCKTIEELRGTCGAMLEALSIDLENSTLDLHNSLWMAEQIDGVPVTFREPFLNALGEQYRSEAHTVDFGKFTAGKQIGEWITEHTRGKIKISRDALAFDPATLAVLINTIYLKDSWLDPFDKTRTEKGVFAGLDPDAGTAKEITVDYMSRSDHNTVIVQGDGWLRYRVRLGAVGSVLFVLPDEGIALEKLLGSPEAIDKLLHAGINKTCNVSLKIPKFSFQDKMELDGVLRSLGLAHCFGTGANFSNMSDTPCMIDRVLQESYIGMDEDGVEAAAYTMVAMRATGYNPVQLETVEFHLTRPFFYAIEAYDGTLLFVGTVTTPNEAETVHK